MYMGKVISIMNFKGGVGKTVTAINMACILWTCGKKVLLVDCDPQASVTLQLKNTDFSKGTLTEWLSTYMVPSGKCTLPCQDVQAPIYQYFDGLDIIPSNEPLSSISSQIEINYLRFGCLDRSFPAKCLKVRIDSVRDNYDYIILDCPPSPGFINDSILFAADTIYTPIQCSGETSDGVSRICEKTRIYNEYGFNKDLKLSAVLLVMYAPNQTITKDTIEVLRQNNIRISDYNIRQDMNVKVGNVDHPCVVIFNPNARASKDYINFVTHEFGVKLPTNWQQKLKIAYMSKDPQA